MCRNIIFFIGVAMFFACANAKFYKDCGSRNAYVEEVTVTECSNNDTVCIIRKNTNVTFSITFISGRNVEEVLVVFHAIVCGVYIPHPLKQPYGCIDHGLKCPLKKNQTVTYTETLHIFKTLPKMLLRLKWELKDEDMDDFVCVMIKAQIE